MTTTSVLVPTLVPEPNIREVYLENKPNTVYELIENLAPFAEATNTQGHFGLTLKSIEDLQQVFPKALKIEYKKALFYDFLNFALLKNHKASRWLSKTATHLPEQSRDETSWELREVTNSDFSVDVPARKVSGINVWRTNDTSAIDAILQEVSGESHKQLRDYPVKKVCHHYYKRMWLIDDENLQLYIDVMQYGKDKFYIVGSVELHNSKTLHVKTYPQLQQLDLIYPVRSKVAFQLSVENKELLNSLETTKYNTEEEKKLCYTFDPLMTEQERAERILILAKTKEYMAANELVGEAEDFVASYTRALSYL